jgi:hypothetical protein
LSVVPVLVSRSRERGIGDRPKKSIDLMVTLLGPVDKPLTGARATEAPR